MTNAFAWLDQLMSWVGRWVPRLILVPPTHRGVLFGPRGGCRERGPGLVVYWPILQALLQVPVTTQSFNLCAQILPAPERVASPLGPIPTVSICAAAVQYRVVDPIKAATKALHLHALVDNRATAAIARHYSSYSSAQTWIKMAADDVTEELAAYGVELERLDPTQMAVGIAIKNLNDWAHSDYANGTHVLSDANR